MAVSRGPRRANLRVAHGQACANSTKTAMSSLKGCTCTPAFYTFHRPMPDTVKKGTRVLDLGVARQQLSELQKRLDQQRVGEIAGVARQVSGDVEKAWTSGLQLKRLVHKLIEEAPNGEVRATLREAYDGLSAYEDATAEAIRSWRASQ